MSRALPVFIDPALNVNTESRIPSWHNSFCCGIRNINNAMAFRIFDTVPLTDIILSVCYFLFRW